MSGSRAELTYYAAVHRAWEENVKGSAADVRAYELALDAMSEALVVLGYERARVLHTRWAETWRTERGTDPWTGEKIAPRQGVLA